MDETIDAAATRSDRALTVVVRVAAALVALSPAACGPGDRASQSPVQQDSTATISASSPSPLSSSPTTAAPPVFTASSHGIDEATRARMTASWRPSCPVPLEELRLLTLSYWGFDGQVHEGELVVHTAYADTVVSVFEALFAARFPIEQMRLVDEFGADDDRSMAANNTSGFNCRAATGSDRWSEHAYGRAVDINPVQNPYVTRAGAVLPPAGAAYLDRGTMTPGMITGDGPVVSAFGVAGWGWGGTWSSAKDYQHFSATGR